MRWRIRGFIPSAVYGLTDTAVYDDSIEINDDDIVEIEIDPSAIDLHTPGLVESRCLDITIKDNPTYKAMMFQYATRRFWPVIFHVYFDNVLIMTAFLQSDGISYDFSSMRHRIQLFDAVYLMSVFGEYEVFYRAANYAYGVHDFMVAHIQAYATRAYKTLIKADVDDVVVDKTGTGIYDINIDTDIIDKVNYGYAEFYPYRDYDGLGNIIDYRFRLRLDGDGIIRLYIAMYASYTDTVTDDRVILIQSVYRLIESNDTVLPYLEAQSIRKLTVGTGESVAGVVNTVLHESFQLPGQLVTWPYGPLNQYATATNGRVTMTIDVFDQGIIEHAAPGFPGGVFSLGFLTVHAVGIVTFDSVIWNCNNDTSDWVYNDQYGAYVIPSGTALTRKDTYRNYLRMICYLRDAHLDCNQYGQIVAHDSQLSDITPTYFDLTAVMLDKQLSPAVNSYPEFDDIESSLSTMLAESCYTANEEHLRMYYSQIRNYGYLHLEGTVVNTDIRVGDIGTFDGHSYRITSVAESDRGYTKQIIGSLIDE